MHQSEEMPWLQGAACASTVVALQRQGRMLQVSTPLPWSRQLSFRLQAGVRPGSSGVQESGSTSFKSSCVQRNSQLALAPSLGLTCLLQDEPHFKFCIFFAGALNRDVHLRHIYEQHIDTPSIHIIGEKVRGACLRG